MKGFGKTTGVSRNPIRYRLNPKSPDEALFFLSGNEPWGDLGFITENDEAPAAGFACGCFGFFLAIASLLAFGHLSSPQFVF